MSDPDTPATPSPETPIPATAPPPSDGNGGLSGGALLRIAGGFYGLVAVFAFGYALFSRITGGGSSEDGPFLGLALPSIGSLASGIGLGLIVVGVVHIGLRMLPAVEDASRHFARILGPLTWREALLLAAFSSIAEELLFRGALWPHLGWIGTSFLFALVHILPKKALWGYPLFALFAGVLFSILREIPPGDGSVFPPILAHFTINALNLWWLGHNHARLTGVVSEPTKPDA